MTEQDWSSGVMETKELRSILQQNGVVCAGGASFPISTKLGDHTKTLILNCAQYEPLLKLQTQLLERYAQEILRTFSLMGSILKADHVIVAMNKKDEDVIEIVETVAQDYPNIVVKLFDGCYPSGDEVVLVYEVTGQLIGPNESLADLGISVFNVETIYNAYKAISFHEPVLDKIVSVLGEVEHPMTIKVPLGTRVEDVVKHAGGITCEKPVYIMGGPMWGHIGNSVSTITKSTDAVLILPDEHSVVQKKKSNTSNELKRAAASCCQCMRCTDLCPRNLLGHPIEPHAFIRAASYKDFHDTAIFINTMFCSTCGLCEMYSCIQGLSPRKLIAEYKAGLQANGIEKPEVMKRNIDNERDYRKISMERLTARLDLLKYNKDASINDENIQVKKVKIMLQQHIGSSLHVVVKNGDYVKAGQVIAESVEEIGTCIHASISGMVCEINEKFIIIETLGGRTDHE